MKEYKIVSRLVVDSAYFDEFDMATIRTTENIFKLVTITHILADSIRIYDETNNVTLNILYSDILSIVRFVKTRRSII